jgi:hypothetical protein
MLAILIIAACLAGGLIEHHRRFGRPPMVKPAAAAVGDACVAMAATNATPRNEAIPRSA